MAKRRKSKRKARRIGCEPDVWGSRCRDSAGKFTYKTCCRRK